MEDVILWLNFVPRMLIEMYLLTFTAIYNMEHLPTQNRLCVIPTERSDEGSLTSVRDDKQTTQQLWRTI